MSTTTKRTAKKAKKRKVNRGGRPRVRDGNEIMLNVEFSLRNYADFAALVALYREQGLAHGEPASAHTKRSLMLELWDVFWKQQPAAFRRRVRLHPVYKKILADGRGCRFLRNTS